VFVRNAAILLFLASSSLSLLAVSPNDASALGPAAPDANDVDVAFVRPVTVEQIPPKHESVWSIVGFTLDATARGLDAYSTCRALNEKNTQEMFLPTTMAKSEPALFGFGASIVLTEYVGYRFLNTHHHERIARWVPYVDAALVFPFAVHNLSLLRPGAANGSSGPAIRIQIR
jgi:hypothetical protein